MLRLWIRTQISSSVMITLITSTHLQLLDLAECDFDEEDWQQVASEVCLSPTLHTLGFGGCKNEDASKVFLRELVDFYPTDGPLEALYSYHYATDSLTSLVETLRNKLKTKALQVYYNASLMRLHHGYKWLPIPTNRRSQIFFSN